MYNNNYTFIVKTVRNDFFFFALGHNNLATLNTETANFSARHFKVHV